MFGDNNQNRNKNKDLYLYNVLNYLEKYDLFISKVALSVKMACPKYELKDVKQELILTLLNNADRYDEVHYSSPNTYYSQIIINGGKKLINQYFIEKNRVYAESVSLDSYLCPLEQDETFLDLVAENNIDYFDPEQNFMENELAERLNDAIGTLSKMEKSVFLDYITGYSIDEIARRHGKSKKTVHNFINNSKKKIRLFLEKFEIAK